MKKLQLASLLLLLATLPAFADKKVTIQNSDNDESFELTMPEGTRVYQYNSNWLDSIPYLIDHARYGEPWAYEALGDCYRYGKGGAQRSIFKAMGYYALAGRDINEETKQLAIESPSDPVGLTYRLMDRLEHKDSIAAQCILDSLDRVGFKDAEVVRCFINDTPKEELAAIVQQNLFDPQVGADKEILTLLGCYAINWYPDFLDKSAPTPKYSLAEKLPDVYNEMAITFFSEDHAEMDSVALRDDTLKAISWLEKADKEAMLSPEGAAILFRHYVAEMEAGRMTPDMENLERLAILSRLSDSELLPDGE